MQTESTTTQAAGATQPVTNSPLDSLLQMPFSALLWEDDLDGDPVGAGHEIALRVDADAPPVTVAMLPMSALAESMRPDDAAPGGSSVMAALDIDEPTMRTIARLLAAGPGAVRCLAAALIVLEKCPDAMRRLRRVTNKQTGESLLDEMKAVIAKAGV